MVDSNEQAALVLLEQEVLEKISEYGKYSIDNFTQSQKLENSILGGMTKIRALTRDLELLVEELDSDEDRQHVARLLTEHAVEYNKIQHAFRAASLQRRENKILSVKQERDELLGSAEGGMKRRQMQTDADVVGASTGITESLRRTRQIMSEELEHTSATLAAMDISHQQLGKTRKEYVGQHSLLRRSKGLLRTIDWQNRSETIMLWGGLILFVLVSLYVAQKRVVYFVPESMRPMALVRTAVWALKSPSTAVMDTPPRTLNDTHKKPPEKGDDSSESLSADEVIVDELQQARNEGVEHLENAFEVEQRVDL